MVKNYIKNIFSRDLLHPFKSGALLLKILYRNNFFQFESEEQEKIYKERIDLLYELLISTGQFSETKDNSKIICII
jgi:hypothetical protein